MLTNWRQCSHLPLKLLLNLLVLLITRPLWLLLKLPLVLVPCPSLTRDSNNDASLSSSIHDPANSDAFSPPGGKARELPLMTRPDRAPSPPAADASIQATAQKFCAAAAPNSIENFWDHYKTNRSALAGTVLCVLRNVPHPYIIWFIIGSLLIKINMNSNFFINIYLLSIIMKKHPFYSDYKNETMVSFYMLIKFI